MGNNNYKQRLTIKNFTHTMGNNIGTSNPWVNQGSNYLVGLWTMTQNTAVVVVFTALALGALILAYIVYKHLKAQSRMMHYKK